MSVVASMRSDRSRSDKHERSDPPAPKEDKSKTHIDKGSEGGEFKGAFGTKGSALKGIFGGSPCTAVVPRLNNPAGSSYPPSLPPPPPQLSRPPQGQSASTAAAPSEVRAARKARDAGEAVITGSNVKVKS